MNDELRRDSGTLGKLDLRLPPLPRTLPEVLRLLHVDGLVEPEAIANVVRNDPAAVAQLLWRINSSYYGLRRSIKDVERAIRMMGPTSAAGAIVGHSMAKMRELLDGPAGSCFTRLIRHSEGTAYFAHYLMSELADSEGSVDGRPAGDRGSIGDGFTEGLLHDFGKLVLLYNFPKKAVQLYEKDRVGEKMRAYEQRKLERTTFGCDHAEAGAYAALEMDFPPVLYQVIRYHHQPEGSDAGETSLRTVRAVSAANLAMKAMGKDYAGVRPGSRKLDWETCGTHPVWRHWIDEKGDDAEARRSLMEDLRAKRMRMVLFTKFFLDHPGMSTPAGPVL